MNEKTIVAGVLGIAVLLLGAAWYSNSQRGSAGSQNDQLTTNQNNSDTSNTNSMSTTELKITDTVVGTGPEATAGSTVSVHYTGTLTTGEVFDSSVPRGEPFSFQLGGGQVIQGWEIGIQGMKVGGKRTLVIPPALAYGDQGVGPIPPNATLRFDVELLDVQDSK